MRQLFGVEQNRLPRLIERNAGVGRTVRNANHHRPVHHRIERLIERADPVIARLLDDFVSADQFRGRAVHSLPSFSILICWRTFPFV